MNIRFLEAFIWVVRLQSFRGAAKKLNVSQATISSRISSLESEFNCRLFERERNEIFLTNKGSILIKKAERLLDYEQDLLESLKRPIDIVHHIRIGVIESIVYSWLGDFLTKLKQLYPSIEFELTAESSLHLQALFKKGALDIMIQTDKVLDSGVVNSELTPLNIQWVCHRDNPIAQQIVSLNKLANFEIITFTRDSHPHLAVASLFEKKNLRPKQIHCVTSIAIISHLVRQGLGIATLPVTAINKELKEGEFVVLNGLEAPPLLTIYASWQNLCDGKMNQTIVELAKAVSQHYHSTQDNHYT